MAIGAEPGRTERARREGPRQEVVTVELRRPVFGARDRASVGLPRDQIATVLRVQQSLFSVRTSQASLVNVGEAETEEVVECQTN